jgi:hypothetical protein
LSASRRPCSPTASSDPDASSGVRRVLLPHMSVFTHGRGLAGARACVHLDDKSSRCVSTPTQLPSGNRHLQRVWSARSRSIVRGPTSPRSRPVPGHLRG